MKKNITDKQMAKYWAGRVAELEGMRPITAQEALAEAENLEREAAILDAEVSAAESTPRETGRVAQGDTVHARDRRNVQALGSARQAVWGNKTRALNLRGRAAALRQIATEKEGTALAKSLAEARQRASYYAKLASV